VAACHSVDEVCVADPQRRKGHRWYAWALVHINDPQPGEHRLLIRRNLGTGELAFHRWWTPEPVPLPALIRVTGTRWRIEENIQAGKGLAALDQHQVRRWTSWHRWTVLAMLAHAFRAVLTVAERAAPAVIDELIPLTCNEIRHLFVSSTGRTRHTIEHVLHWSLWRSRQQARASHYRRRDASRGMITIYGCRTNPGLTPDHGSRDAEPLLASWGSSDDGRQGPAPVLTRLRR